MRPPSAQQKIIAVNDHFGNPQIAKQQGSTVEVFDFIKIDPTETNYTFFKDANSKKFPFTNLQEGKLQPQESFIMSYAYFTLMSIDTSLASQPIIEQRRIVLTLDPALMAGTMEVQIENNIVVKPLPIRSFATEFNNAAENNIDGVYDFLTKIALLPLLNFQANVKMVPGFFTLPVDTDVYIGLTLGGPGAIFAPRSNY